MDASTKPSICSLKVAFGLMPEIVKKKEKEEKVHAVTGAQGTAINVNDDKNKGKKKDGGCC